MIARAVRPAQAKSSGASMLVLIGEGLRDLWVIRRVGLANRAAPV